MTREHWNRRHAEGPIGPPSSFLLEVADLLPTEGTAVDVAGGSGRNAMWLAARGLEVTLMDVSDVALQRAATEAGARGLEVHTVRADLEAAGMPTGTWSVVICFHFLHRPLFPALVGAVAPGGLLVCQIATVHNLARHRRPPRDFLLAVGELERLVAPLQISILEEGWDGDERHTARVVARCP